MPILHRLVHAWRRRTDRRPAPGLWLRPRKEDALRDYPADGLTPSRLLSIFKQADGGALSAQMALFEQMEEKDAHLYSVAHTRRLAVTGLPWRIVSAADVPGGPLVDRRAADAAAAWCEAALHALPGFEEALSHLALALGRNLSLVELVWRHTALGPRLVELVPVDFNRLLLDDHDRLRVLVDDDDREGRPLPPDKFVVHQPGAVCGRPARGGLLRVTALAYLAKHFALKDWLVFAEVFGMPVRIARYGPSATPEEKRELLEMLRQLGADAVGVFSQGVQVDIQQPRMPGETNLYENLCLYCDREISKAWLGQTLTTDTIRSKATAGAAQVHDRVRRDIRDDDLRKEAATLRRDLLAPLVRFQFGPNAPVPHFRRLLDHTLEPERLGAVLDVAVNRLGLRVPARYAHAALGLPQADPNEPILPGSGDARQSASRPGAASPQPPMQRRPPPPT